MSTRSQLTKDLNESVKALLGKHVKILLKNVVRLETKGDKTENRVLVFSPCRLFLLTAKVPTRIDCHFHYLEIESLESKRGNQLTISTSGEKTYSFLTGEDSACSTDTDAMIGALATAVRNIFPGVPLERVIRRVEVLPPERLELAGGRRSAADPPVSGAGVGPCGGFSTQYACMCDYHGVPYRDEVAWDVDTIYLSHDARELCLRDFEHLDARDLVPIVSALEHNAWFECLRAGGGGGATPWTGGSGTAGATQHSRVLPHDALERVLHVVRRTVALERLHLDSLGLRHEFAARLANAIAANDACPLHTIDLAHNAIEDKGLAHLNKQLSRLAKGPVHLDFGHCSLTAKGVNALAAALHANPNAHTTLTHLCLAGNSISRDDLHHLYNFLAQPNAIAHLDLSATDTVLESLFGALLRGCATNLAHLDVSRNPFSASKKPKDREVPPSFKQFFMSTLCLKRLDMSGCRLPQEALKNLLLGLACNESTAEVRVDLSSCALGPQGAHVLESCVHGVRCIGALDISDNALDADLAGVVLAVGRNKSLRSLNVGRNLQGCKAKHVAAVVEAVVQCIQEDDCVLAELRIADSRLKQDLHALLNALGSNKCLRMLDVSGNGMGDAGARLLAKALQINTRLRELHLDRNGVTLQGYGELAYALEKNYTLRYVPYPTYDALACAKQSTERTEQLWRRVQDLLQRNADGPGAAAARRVGSQAFRLQQGFLLGGAQQLVDRLVVQTQDTVRQLESESPAGGDRTEDIDRATRLVQDADNSKHLLMRLRDCVRRDALERRLERCAGDMHAAVSAHLEAARDAMLECARAQCPHVLADRHGELMTELRRACRERSQVPDEWTRETVARGAQADILARVAELQLAVAAHVSDRVTDEVIEALTRTYKALVGDMNRNNRPAVSVTVATRPRLSSGGSAGAGGGSGGGTARDDLSVDSQTSDQSPVATPHMQVKRKSLHGRRLRPKSVVDSVEGLSADDIPSRLSAGDDDDTPTSSSGGGGTGGGAEESLDSVSELPGQQLQHLVKGRPRRAKTRAPTRPMLHGAGTGGVSGTTSGGATDDDEDGLDVFWRPGSVTPTGARSPATAAPPPGESSAETTPILGADRKLDAPRSRSSDSLGCSPIGTRRAPAPQDAKPGAGAAVPRSHSGGDAPRPARPWSVASATDSQTERETPPPPTTETATTDIGDASCIVKPVAAPRKFIARRSEVRQDEMARSRRAASKLAPLDANHNVGADAIDV